MKTHRNAWLALAATPEQHCLVRALFDSIKIGLALQSSEIFAQVVAKVGLWRTYIGAIKDVDSALITVEANFLIQTYPDLTIEELDWCIKLYTACKLISHPNYINFSPAFMSRVIESFIQYKNDLSKSLLQAKEAKELKQANEVKVTPAERMDNMKYMIEQVYLQLENDVDQVVMLADVYKYLRKTNRIRFDDTIIENAKQFAEKKIQLLKARKTQDALTVAKLMNAEKENLHRLYGKEYCVRWYFQSHTLEEALSLVKEKDFVA